MIFFYLIMTWSGQNIWHTKQTPSFRFVPHLKGCLEKLKEPIYFSLIRYFMEYGATVWDPYQRYTHLKI